MLFNSVNYLIFFPVVLAVYFVIPRRWRYVFLLIASYYFYMSWNPKYALLMLTTTAVTYFGGRAIASADSSKQAPDSAEVPPPQRTTGILYG